MPPQGEPLHAKVTCGKKAKPDMLTALEHELQMVAVSGIHISQTPG